MIVVADSGPLHYLILLDQMGSRAARVGYLGNLLFDRDDGRADLADVHGFHRRAGCEARVGVRRWREPGWGVDLRQPGTQLSDVDGANGRHACRKRRGIGPHVRRQPITRPQGVDSRAQFREVSGRALPRVH